MAKKKGQVQYCYEQRLKENPSIGGRIGINVDIANGRVTNVTISENQTGDKAIEGVSRARSVGGDSALRSRRAFSFHSRCPRAEFSRLTSKGARQNATASDDTRDSGTSRWGRPAYAQGVGGTVEISRSGDPREMAQYVRSALEEMMSGLKAVSKLADAARREGDDEMVQCVQARLSNIRALLMVSERANGAMKEAVGSANVQRAEHEFRKVVVSLAKVGSSPRRPIRAWVMPEQRRVLQRFKSTQSGLTVGDDSQALDNYFHGGRR